MGKLESWSKEMDNQQIRMPMFGSASAAAQANSGSTSMSQSDWGDPSSGVDFDVEMLAEYLLEDPATFSTNGTLAFDFKLDGAGSGVVSIENSEDGTQPSSSEAAAPTAVTLAPAATSAPNVAQPQTATAKKKPKSSFTPIAPTPFLPTQQTAALPAGFAIYPSGLVPSTGLDGVTQQSGHAPLGGLGHHQHGTQHTGGMASPSAFMSSATASPAAINSKRRRVNPTTAASALFPVASAPHFPGQAIAVSTQHPRQGMVGVVAPSPFAQSGAAPMLLPVTQQQLLHSKIMNNAEGASSLQLSGQQLAAAAAHAMQTQAVAGHGARGKSPAQVERRRERNKILARRTRLRKKFFFEALQKEVMDLQKENALLKELVTTNLPQEHSRKILDECDAMEKMPPSVLEALGEVDSFEARDFNLVRSIQNSQHAFIITDPSLPDNPIVFCSDDFCETTGYKRDQVLGRNCRFLQGKETCPKKLSKVKMAIAEGVDVSVTFVNYMADGTPFWNKLFVAALRDAQNHIVNFIGVLVRVAAPAPEDPEHGKVLSPLGETSVEEPGAVTSAPLVQKDSPPAQQP